MEIAFSLLNQNERDDVDSGRGFPSLILKYKLRCLHLSQTT